MFDTRIKPFKPIVEVKVDTTFATTCDIWTQGNEDKYLVTGHRGFNDSGAEVKLWDLRKVQACKNEDKVNNLTNFVYDGHSFSPESVRFIKPIESLTEETPMRIVSASKDSSLRILKDTGELVTIQKNTDGFACMDVMAGTPWNDKQRVIVSADIKQRLQLYVYDEND